ncbi:MAG TPA: hypothetical protein VG892_03820 [Terriglobales bacterium]|jgi:hypothetical protein|nr:hypothetical protein [Terriglobales bacterium]
MKPEDYSERELQVEGWPVKVTSYRLESEYHCTVDNVSPGAWVARSTGANKQEAEERALSKARERLARTRRNQV